MSAVTTKQYFANIEAAVAGCDDNVEQHRPFVTELINSIHPFVGWTMDALFICDPIFFILLWRAGRNCVAVYVCISYRCFRGILISTCLILSWIQDIQNTGGDKFLQKISLWVVDLTCDDCWHCSCYTDKLLPSSG